MNNNFHNKILPKKGQVAPKRIGVRINDKITVSIHSR
jgi:hypothetical protein